MNFKVSTLALAIAFTLVLSRYAEAITISNHSFETDVVPNDGNAGTFSDETIAGVPTSWTGSGTILHTSRSDTFWFANLITTTPDADTNDQFVQLTPATSSSLYQTLGDTLAANTQYTLTIDVGDVIGYAYNPGSVNLGYGATFDANLLTPTSSTLNTPANGNWATWQLVFVTGASPAGLGQSLRIDLKGPAAAGDGVGMYLDNVRLDAVAVAAPEPGALALFGIGLAALCFNRRSRMAMREKYSHQI